MQSSAQPSTWQISVGLGSCGMAAGADKLFGLLSRLQDKYDFSLKQVGCNGLCNWEPLLEITDPTGKSWLYGEVKENQLEALIEHHLFQKLPSPGLLLKSPENSHKGTPFLERQKRIVLENCGQIDPESIKEYLAKDGYQPLERVVTQLSAAEVISIVTESGLRGRGGAGFPTGRKWQAAAQLTANQKFVICNADEGDPGAFMDRSIIESDPHRVIEGLLITAFAIGAKSGYLYVRAEYPLALKRLQIALQQARQYGFLGNNIFGSSFCCQLEIREGAGAFVCGEETALIQSIEGERGMPKLRPPFPVEQGLWGYPTVINNVETLANVPWIIRNGPQKFAALGTCSSKGTKVFALAGKVKRGGLAEVVMGTTLREIVEEIGGGSSTTEPIKAVQTGGPSGGCLPSSLFDTPVDYEELAKTGAIMGSGGLIVIDQSTCMVELARYFLTFTRTESCGKCTFCRIGTQRLLEILERITAGQGNLNDLELLEELAAKIKSASLCGLGQTAPNPVLTTLHYFRDEYLAHIIERLCPARSCKALIRYQIDPEKCVGCTACSSACPVSAISGSRKEPHQIDQQLCTKCGACFEVCKFEAISIT